ncbi:MAG: O-antigen ligase family protein [Ardenticatenaceae bacterium]|nr:O-antigen ligase family protein [Ardenticatenaceae bacterium]
MDSKLFRWCDGLIEAGWLTAVIAIPLFFNIHSDRVFEPDKLTLLRSIAVLMSAAWLVKFVDGQGWQQFGRLRWTDKDSIWRKPFVLPILLLVLVYLISTVLSVTPRVSWAGSYQRLQGTYTTLSYIVVFALLISTIRTRAQVSRVVTAVIITSIPISFYALLQHFDLDPLPWGGNVVSRVAGHMGNAIFIAAYLIMAVPLTIGRIIDAFTKILSDEELATADVVRSSIYIFTVAIQLIAIYWSQSRGPWLGLFAGLFAFILIVLVSLRNAAADSSRFHWNDWVKALALSVGGTAVLFTVFLFLFRALTAGGRLTTLAGPASSFVALAAAVGLLVLVIFVMIAARQGWRWLWLAWLILSLVVIGWLVMFNFGDELDARYGETAVLGDITQNLAAWQDLPAIGRLGKLLDSESRTGKVRVLIWEGVLDLISVHQPLQFPDGQEDGFNFLRPLIGYGPESMYVAYNPFYPPQLATVEARNASPDRSHNETFDALVITGVFGFLVWQALYLSVFYYAFRWLGVVRSKRDRNLLLASWIGGAVLITLLITQTMGMPFLGVAIPFGSILGLIVYLIYYALTAQTGRNEDDDPFHVDRLLMTALVAAVLAHYVEIHFGIAIAATRTYFFVYVALMFLVGYRLPQIPEPTVMVATKSRKRRVESENNAWAPLLQFAFMMTLMLGIMGFEYTTYSLPPDKIVQSAADLPASEIFYQSLFINARNGFVDSPFIFLMMMLTWVLGLLAGVSEMVKNGELSFTAVSGKLTPGRKQGALVLLGIMGIGSLILRFLPSSTSGATAQLGHSLVFLWAGLAAWAGVRLVMDLPGSQLLAGSVGMAGLLFAVPVLIAGGTLFGLVTAVLSTILFYLVWDKSWRDNLAAVGVAAFLSIGLGMLYAYVQASLLRSSLLFQPPQTVATIEELRVLEASQSTTFLAAFYVFAFALMFVSALVVFWPDLPRLKNSGTAVAFASLVVLFVVAFIAINRTNMRIIQADVIYKRGKPFDDQATQTRDIENWKVATAVYEKALSLAPKEDFYYLFLGRAYLEQSTITSDPIEQAALLDTAEKRLLLAQDINPLNTDHTANLARLNTRWWQLSSTDADKQARAQKAANYYEEALTLSPHNSVIRNEYARLAYDILDDCQKSIDLYEESVAIDPYYDMSYFGRADVYVACGAKTDETTRQDYYGRALDSLQQGLALSDNNVRAWLQAAQLYQQLGRFDEALSAYEEAAARNKGEIAVWNLDFLMANLYWQKGDNTTALALAEQSLAAAPAEVSDQIRQFITDVSGESVSP